MEDIIKAEKEYLVNVLGKRLIDSEERDDKKNGYRRLAKKYWPEEFTDNVNKHVHHIDFDNSNNIVSNLVVLTPGEHEMIHNLFDPKSEEVKQKRGDAISKALKGKNTGKHLSEDTKRRIGDAVKGKNKGKEPWIKGKHLSAETKQKISEANKGKRHNHTEETKQKIRDAAKGKYVGKHWKLVNGKRVWY